MTALNVRYAAFLRLNPDVERFWLEWVFSTSPSHSILDGDTLAVKRGLDPEDVTPCYHFCIQYAKEHGPLNESNADVCKSHFSWEKEN